MNTLHSDAHLRLSAGKAHSGGAKCVRYGLCDTDAVPTARPTVVDRQPPRYRRLLAAFVDRAVGRSLACNRTLSGASVLFFFQGGLGPPVVQSPGRSRRHSADRPRLSFSFFRTKNSHLIPLHVFLRAHKLINTSGAGKQHATAFHLGSNTVETTSSSHNICDGRL